jgi:hypothetical protein
MYTLINTYKKPTSSTLFFFEYYKYPSEYLTYVNKHYRETGKLLKYQKTLSSDNMTAEVMTSWSSREDFLSFITDEFIYNFTSMSNNYDINNDIEVTVTIKRTMNNEQIYLEKDRS